jgi:hypothetical protein
MSNGHPMPYAYAHHLWAAFPILFYETRGRRLTRGHQQTQVYNNFVSKYIVFYIFWMIVGLGMEREGYNQEDMNKTLSGRGP